MTNCMPSKKKVEIVAMLIAGLAMLGAILFFRNELKQANQRLETIDSLIQENQRLREDKVVLEQRIDIFFREDTTPIQEEAVEMMKSGWFQIALSSQVVSQIRSDTKKYACFDFSRDLRNLLLKKGIPSKIDVVKPKDPKFEKDYHAVVSIQIEPQSGEIVYYRTEDLIDQCFEAEKNGQYYCSQGKVVTKPNGVEVYESFKEE